MAEKRFDSAMATKYPFRILLTEDNSVNQKVGLLMLSRLGYKADLAANGPQALKATEKTPYDLIFMDIQPLTLTMDDAHAMEQAATQAGVKVVVNHYRRYHPAFRQAKELLQAGAIGQLSMISASIEGWDLMEWGTHWLDMIRFFVNDQSVAWVMGQARCTGEKKGYGHIMEQHAMAYFGFADGIRGFLDASISIPGSMPYSLKVSGADGHLEVSESKLLLVNREGLREIPVTMPKDPTQDPWQLLLDDFTAWLDGGKESQLSLRNAVCSTELYLAAYESAKKGDRIDLPLASQSQFPLDEIARRQSGK